MARTVPACSGSPPGFPYPSLPTTHPHWNQRSGRNPVRRPPYRLQTGLPSRGNRCGQRGWSPSILEPIRAPDPKAQLTHSLMLKPQQPKAYYFITFIILLSRCSRVEIRSPARRIRPPASAARMLHRARIIRSAALYPFWTALPHPFLWFTGTPASKFLFAFAKSVLPPPQLGCFTVLESFALPRCTPSGPLHPTQFFGLQALPR